MPLFKLSGREGVYEDAAIDAAILSVIPFFELEDSPDFGSMRPVVSSFIFEFEATDVPFIEIPSIVLSFEGTMADTETATVLASLPLILASFEASEEADFFATIQVAANSIMPVFDVEVPPLNECKIFSRIHSLIPFFDVTVPVIADMQISVPVNLEFILYEPVTGRFSLRLPRALPLFSAKSLEQNMLSAAIPKFLFNFFALSEQTDADHSINIPLVFCSMFVENGSGAEVTEAVIRFDYEQWMFALLKAKTAELDDEDVIKFVSNLLKEGAP
jgi:hypothetical protein